jgi:hypothetical protein
MASRRVLSSRTISRGTPRTLQDLLDTIRADEPEQTQLTAMLRATAAHICMYLGQSPDAVSIQVLFDVKPGLQAHLRERGFKRSAIRVYTNYFLRVLLRKAKELGWTESSPELVEAWRQILLVYGELIC